MSYSQLEVIPIRLDNRPGINPYRYCPVLGKVLKENTATPTGCPHYPQARRISTHGLSQFRARYIKFVVGKAFLYLARRTITIIKTKNVDRDILGGWSAGALSLAITV
ncbi:hypothetical protein [Desulfolucanica intricata]|uniref:hypothetical protein n=1 Tax=Desulfolucanica intricata TaxID=1285191 RepID=UPI0008328C15|nr:hypothetical protein [Desulfolucanica intricata]